MSASNSDLALLLLTSFLLAFFLGILSLYVSCFETFDSSRSSLAPSGDISSTGEVSWQRTVTSDLVFINLP